MFSYVTFELLFETPPLYVVVRVPFDPVFELLGRVEPLLGGGGVLEGGVEGGGDVTIGEVSLGFNDWGGFSAAFFSSSFSFSPSSA